MPALEYSSADAHNTRRLARTFTPTVPDHHPFLDPDFPEEDEHLVPAALAPRGKLNWELPKKATTNLHIMLKLTNKADELLDEWRDKIPQIDEVVTEWSEMKGASPTTLGEMQLHAQALFNDSCGEAQSEADTTGIDSSDGYVFNMAKNLDSPGRGDVIYLTNGVEDDKYNGKKGSMPKNLRNVEWLDFDGSHVHMADEAPKSRPLRVAFDLPEQSLDLGDSSTSRLSSVSGNIRSTDWNLEELLSPTVYSPTAASDVGHSDGEARPFDDFWLSHQAPNGPSLALRDENNELDNLNISPSNGHHSEWRPLNLRT